MSLFDDYKKKQLAIKTTKGIFAQELEKELKLIEVCAPLLVKSGAGIQDGLNGTERPVSVKIKTIPDEEFEIIHSLAKWKRLILSEKQFQPEEGIYTNMIALRPDEEKLDALHSVLVDQWDWEMIIDKQERSLEKLKVIVTKIYRAIYTTHQAICTQFQLTSFLPAAITFVHSEDLAREFPNKNSKEREKEICKKHKAVFLIGIGGVIADDKPHDGRAPDYDDWSTSTSPEHQGLNGDILVWNPILEDAFEVSSMGIRVDKEALVRQLKIKSCEQELTREWHQKLMQDKLMQTIGGGIGKSRLTMLLLQLKHIAEVQ